MASDSRISENRFFKFVAFICLIFAIIGLAELSYAVIFMRNIFGDIPVLLANIWVAISFLPSFLIFLSIGNGGFNKRILFLGVGLSVFIVFQAGFVPDRGLLPLIVICDIIALCLVIFRLYRRKWADFEFIYLGSILLASMGTSISFYLLVFVGSFENVVDFYIGQSAAGIIDSIKFSDDLIGADIWMRRFYIGIDDGLFSAFYRHLTYFCSLALMASFIWIFGGVSLLIWHRRRFEKWRTRG